MAYSDRTRESYRDELEEIREAGLFKEERTIETEQSSRISVRYPEGAEPREVINLCANNYLGLSSHPEVIRAAHEGLDERGHGLSSVRFICGTQDIHRDLEHRLTDYLGTEDTILFPSCFDANGGVFEAVLGPDDVMIADRLVHASIVDGMRLAKAAYDTFKHGDMKHLRKKLEASKDYRYRLIITDGVFSMDGDIARLDEICELADEFDAMVFVDDAHATGFVGPKGRGTHEEFGVMGRVDLISTTLGKALGGASGGCISGRSELVELCRQRARPYLFSNSVAPVIVSGALRVLDLITGSSEWCDRVWENTRFWRQGLTEAGFDVREGRHPIVPVMLYNAKLAQDFARDLYREGVYVIGFFFPVVPKGQARIRTQLSAAHERDQLERALEAFVKVGEKYGVLGKGKREIVEQYGT